MAEWLQAEVVVFQLLFLRISSSNWREKGRLNAPVDKEPDGKHYSKSRRRMLTYTEFMAKYVGE
jgi:hypothetical protein